MAMNWKALAKGLGIAGAVGGVFTLGSTIIKAVVPEARDLPAEHAAEIKRLVAETMEAEKKKS